MKNKALKRIVSFALVAVMIVSAMTVSMVSASAASNSTDKYYYSFSFYTASNRGVSPGAIQLRLNGVNGSTDWVRIAGGGAFSGHRSSGFWDKKDIGEITSITCKKSGDDGWYPEYFSIYDRTKEKSVTLFAGKWVKNDEEVTFKFTDNVCALTVTTADKLWAGTDANVYATFYDNNNHKSKKINLSHIYSSENAFERGDTGIMYIALPNNFGKLSKIKFSVSNGDNTIGPDWTLGSVQFQKLQGTNIGEEFSAEVNKEIVLDSSYDVYFN